MLMVGLFTRLAALHVAVCCAAGAVRMAGRDLHRRMTMAACNLAMGTTLLLDGGSAYSVDNVLLRLRPALALSR
jgi:thiosulfate dehydrogenase [quinone] large subunit